MKMPFVLVANSTVFCLIKRSFALQVKDAELKELEDHSKKLEVMIEKLKSDIELLENTSRVGIEKSIFH